MKQLVLFIFLMQLGYASTYTLNKILRSAAQNSTLSKALQQESLALEAKNRANTASDPMELFGEGGKAYPDVGENGNEYAIGISKKIVFGNIQEQEQRVTRLSNEATLLEAQRSILDFKNELKNIYHQHCLDKQNYRSFRQSYREFEKLYKKKQKAYKYQEISKTELMQLEIEKSTLNAKLQEIKMQQEISKQNLFMMSKIHYTKSTELSCKDMYPIRGHINLGDTFQLSKEAHQKRIQSTHEELNRYSSTIDSLSISGQYSQELDMEKYSVGLSIPLNFTSERSEQKRAAAMYQNSAISFKYEQKMREKNTLLAQLQSYLKSNALMVNRLKSNYKNYQNNLLPMIKKSYDLGETSVIEYLLNRQRSYQLRQEIYSTKKAYYNTLFRLYSISEKKDN
ncbi:MAG: TolC family protein [Campylobacterota bacterium]